MSEHELPRASQMLNQQDAELTALRAENERLKRWSSQLQLTVTSQSLWVDRAHARAEKAEARVAELEALLTVAKCPNCDGSGAIPRGPDPDGNWEAEQCQWCHESSAALAGREG